MPVCDCPESCKVCKCEFQTHLTAVLHDLQIVVSSIQSDCNTISEKLISGVNSKKPPLDLHDELCDSAESLIRTADEIDEHDNPDVVVLRCYLANGRF